MGLLGVLKSTQLPKVLSGHDSSNIIIIKYSVLRINVIAGETGKIAIVRSSADLTLI